eukprot:11228349-Lingulodinium_polyedra.AAC.2
MQRARQAWPQMHVQCATAQRNVHCLTGNGTASRQGQCAYICNATCPAHVRAIWHVGCVPQGTAPCVRANSSRVCKQCVLMTCKQRECTNSASACVKPTQCAKPVHSTCIGVTDAPNMRACNGCTNRSHAHATDGWRTIPCFATHNNACSRRYFSMSRRLGV